MFETDLSGPPSHYDVHGGDRVRMIWQDPEGDFIQRVETVWYMQAEAGSSMISGKGRPGKHVHVSAQSATATPRGSGSATTSVPVGSWGLTLRKNGHRAKARVGDLVTGNFASDANLRVRDVSAHVDIAAHTVSGTCFPDDRFGMRTYDPAGDEHSVGYGQAGGDGSWAERAPGDGPRLAPRPLVCERCG